MAPVQGMAPALPPEQGLLQHQLILPWLLSLWGSCKECPAPEEGVTLRNWNMTQQGNGLGNFYCPQNYQLFGGPLFLLHQLHFLPPQNGVFQQAVGEGH